MQSFTERFAQGMRSWQSSNQDLVPVLRGKIINNGDIDEEGANNLSPSFYIKPLHFAKDNAKFLTTVILCLNRTSALPSDIIRRIVNHCDVTVATFIKTTRRNVPQDNQNLLHLVVPHPLSLFRNKNDNYGNKSRTSILGITFVVDSKDQGWADTRTGERDSFSWIELGLLNESYEEQKDFERFELHTNMRAGKYYEKIAYFFDVKDEKNKGLVTVLENWKDGFFLGLFIRSKYAGWKNHVQRMEVITHISL